MRSLKQFDEFLKNGAIKKQSPDKDRAKSLNLEAENKLQFLEKLKTQLGFKELNPNYVVETCYDILIQILRAKLLSAGYKTDSHEAEVSFMRNLGFSESDVLFMNELRYFRNGIKYYGKIFDNDYAQKIYDFLIRLLIKLK